MAGPVRSDLVIFIPRKVPPAHLDNATGIKPRGTGLQAPNPSLTFFDKLAFTNSYE